MATSDLLSHVGLVTSKSSLPCVDAEHLPLLVSLASLETNSIVTSVSSDLLGDASPVFSTNVDTAFASISKDANFGNRTTSTLSNWVPNGEENLNSTSVALPPVTELHPTAPANSSLDFLGLLTNSGLNLQNGDSFLDFPMLSKLPSNNLSMMSKTKSTDAQKTVDTQSHIPESSMLLVTPQNASSADMSSSLGHLIATTDNSCPVTSTSVVTTAGDLQFVESVIPSTADYGLAGLSGLTPGPEGTPNGHWDSTLSLINSNDGVAKSAASWQNDSDLLDGAAATAVEMLLPDSVPTYPEVPDNIFAQTVEEIHCYKCKFCVLYISMSKEDALSHLRSVHSKELVQMLPLSNWNAFDQNATYDRAPAGGACDTPYLQEPVLAGGTQTTDIEGSFVCGKCQKNFKNLQECTRHLAEVHHIKSSRIRLEKTLDQPKPANGLSAEQQPKKTSKVKVSPDDDPKGANTESAGTNRRSKKRKTITPMQKFARQKLKREQGCYICEFKGCNVRYQLLDNLEYHRKCHILGSSSFSCPECGNQTERWAPMAGHLWRQHLVDLELNACDQCSFRTYSLTKMENLHKRTHGNERPYLCDNCGKKFKTSKQLYNHKMVHETVTIQDTCTICNRRFTEKRMLRVHMDNVHNKVRPFVCNFCGYSASCRSTLKMHLRQHTGEKPFACDKCSYRTSDHNSLRRHKMRHSGEKPYKCPYCKYACIQSSTYKEHLKSKHPGLNEGLMFSCTQCPFRTIKQDIFATHMSDHKMEASMSSPAIPESPLNLTLSPSDLLGGEGPSSLQEMSLADALQISIAQPSSLRLLSALADQKHLLPLQQV